MTRKENFLQGLLMQRKQRLICCLFLTSSIFVTDRQATNRKRFTKCKTIPLLRWCFILDNNRLQIGTTPLLEKHENELQIFCKSKRLRNRLNSIILKVEFGKCNLYWQVLNQHCFKRCFYQNAEVPDYYLVSFVP